MMARRDLSSEKLNVGPGQYTPGYIYGKEKSPSFRYYVHDVVWGGSTVRKASTFPVPGSTNTDLT